MKNLFEAGDILVPVYEEDSVKYPQWVGLEVLEYSKKYMHEATVKLADGEIIEGFNLDPSYPYAVPFKVKDMV